MIRRSLHALPRWRDILLEQVRIAGLSLRREAVVAAVLVALATIGVTAEVLRRGEVIDFHPERWILPGLIGLLLPVFVWAREERFGSGFPWTLPVERRQLALTRVFAGWVWLMGTVAVFVLWLLGLALLSGGNFLGEETLRVLPSSVPLPMYGTISPEAVQTVRWNPEPLLWLAPFTGATALYLLGSTLALGLRRPLRWIVAMLLGLVLLGAVTDAVGRVTELEWLIFAPSRLLRSLLYEPYGLQSLLTARIMANPVLSTGETVVVWRGLPDLWQWAKVTLLWNGAGLGALYAAVSRHREDRRR